MRNTDYILSLPCFSLKLPVKTGNPDIRNRVHLHLFLFRNRGQHIKNLHQLFLNESLAGII